MNGKNLFLGLSYIDRKFIEEAETDTIPAKHLSIKRPLLIAAMIGLMLLLVGCAVGYVNGWFADFFASRSEIPLSDAQVDFIQDNEQIIKQTQALNDWTVELKSTMTDGETGYILFGITAPMDVNLEEYYENSKKDLHAPYITPGNYSMRAGHRAMVIASTGFSDENLNFYWNENGHWEADNDNVSNTLDYIIELKCEKLYPNRERKLKRPFGKDISFQVRFFDFTLEYENQEVRESVDSKLTEMGDGIIDGEELKDLYKSEVLVEGEWLFDVTFTNTALNSLELITQPITIKAWVHRKIENGTMFYDTTHAIEEIQLNSFCLSPMGADAIYQEESDVIGVFLEWDGNRGVYVIMRDGSQIQLKSDGTGYTWSSEIPIILDDVDYVVLADGTKVGAQH